uniref:Uncharacterized protein n=1 Tax=Arundo donax TaxID=35708 RepID=A0A0A9F3Z2_ARUDO
MIQHTMICFTGSNDSPDAILRFLFPLKQFLSMIIYCIELL